MPSPVNVIAHVYLGTVLSHKIYHMFHIVLWAYPRRHPDDDVYLYELQTRVFKNLYHMFPFRPARKV
jgi:hypothetical protein